MPKAVNPKDTTREKAFTLWMDAKNPMVTFTKTLDVTKLIRLRKKEAFEVQHADGLLHRKSCIFYPRVLYVACRQ